MLLDDAVGHRQAEAGAASLWFGREERLEDLGQVLLPDPRPRINELHQDFVLALRIEARPHRQDRERVVEGKRGDLGGRRIIKKKKKKETCCGFGRIKTVSGTRTVCYKSLVVYMLALIGMVVTWGGTAIMRGCVIQLGLHALGAN